MTPTPTPELITVPSVREIAWALAAGVLIAALVVVVAVEAAHVRAVHHSTSTPHGGMR